ncbi:MAG: T9SS type A sorting domain-containing protein [Ignavibacterium sp.]
MKFPILFLYILILSNSQILAQWSKIEAITSPFIFSALFDENNIFVGGDSLYISRDSGKSWTATAPSGQTIEITALFKTDDIIFLGTYGSGIYISTNSGDSWQSFNNGLNSYALYAKKFVVSGDTVFYGTDGGGVYYTKLGSNLWISYNEGLLSNVAWTINDLTVTSNNLIVSAGASGFYFVRPKGSAQWIEKRIQTPQGIYTTPNAFLSTENIVFFGSRFGIYKSLDEGNTFDSVGISAMDMSVVSFTKDKNRIYAGYTRSSGNDFFVWYSDDFGNNWNIFDHQFQFLLNLYVYDNKIWAGTNDGLWYKELETTSSEPIEKPSNFKLEQNFPNPFNPSTKIKFSIPNVGSELTKTVLKVYDVLGNEIAILVDEYKPVGNYEVEFNASKLSSGVYFYHLQAGDPSTSSGQGFIETRKMILIK